MIHTKLLAGCVMAAAMAAAPALADDRSLPPAQVIDAINVAVAAYPGRVKEVEVTQENGRLLVEVEIVAEGGRERELTVDPATREVVSR
ncbi:PepSY domain-containing protein [Ramlibacter sp. AN1015]|uniref:PepSY domain-containing protein n=1 Tax=Ramlibacter sp. AN1015 TaxID=3133428 RepID=UPI0030C1AAE2